MNKKYKLFEFHFNLKYGVKQLVEFENSEAVRMQKCRTSIILLTGFIIYCIIATIITRNTYMHGKVTNLNIAFFFFVIIILVIIFKKHTNLCIIGSFGTMSILFFHMITEVDWTIGMDAYWLFILILPFLTNYIAGVVYGSISALSGLALSLLLFRTFFKHYLQPYGSNMVDWFPIIYVVVMFAAAIMEYELTSYQIAKKESDEKIAHLQNERTRRLQEQLSIYESNEVTLRKYKHDIRHFNRVLAGLINDNEYEKASAYLLEFDSMLEQVTTVSFCDNKIINELLTIYTARCQKDGYKLRAKAVVPERIPIQGVELTSLVANALENAIEAQQKVVKEKRFIQFEISYDGKKLKLMTKNPIGDNVHFTSSGLPLSTKEIQSGIGTQQINSIAKKYGGAASFTVEDGWFILRVFLSCM